MLILRKITGIILVVVTLLSLSGYSQATVMARAAMTIHNLTFDSSDPFAELLWFEEDITDPFSGWRGDIFAQAQDTLTGTDAAVAEVYGDNEAKKVEAATALVTSVAEYKVVNGPEVAKGGGDAEVITGTGLEINDPTTAQASGEAGGTLDNIFLISGGAPGGTVDVTFTLDYAYLLDAIADGNGYYEVFVFAALEIFDLDDVLGDPDNVDDFVDDVFLRFDAGSATGIFEQDSGTLVVSATLEYEKDYFLFGAADSEIFATNEVPEPVTLLLSLWGLAFLLLKHPRRRRR